MENPIKNRIVEVFIVMGSSAGIVGLMELVDLVLRIVFIAVGIVATLINIIYVRHKIKKLGRDER